jgi:uncharacterized protein YhaN
MSLDTRSLIAQANGIPILLGAKLVADKALLRARPEERQLVMKFADRMLDHATDGRWKRLVTVQEPRTILVRSESPRSAGGDRAERGTTYDLVADLFGIVGARRSRSA